MNTSSPSFSPSPTPFTHRSLKVGKKISNLPEGSCFQYFLNPLLGASSGSPKTSGSASPLPPTTCPAPLFPVRLLDNSSHAPAPGPLHWPFPVPSQMSFLQAPRAALANFGNTCVHVRLYQTTVATLVLSEIGSGITRNHGAVSEWGGVFPLTGFCPVPGAEPAAGLATREAGAPLHALGNTPAPSTPPSLCSGSQ